ncbi:FAD-dependent oxidoreductase [Mucilaginibacter sp. HC2]|uniref:NAD(P)-binding protein n=1 Tax=Mucilaginibacter inviolabilis TaxID=2714892 RepID=UPI00140B5554|nr:NAD(P)-binding protein [Mucilaginibacter inviolabilis]NHA05470.1 FAD-dependent oxidoreductase [Mucilaginibacter inviolabilis]
MDESASELIFEQSTVVEYPGVYTLGCYAKRVTFHSQQNRALNLVCALFEEGKINEKSKIGIVGGGLAGMTAAAAASSKGCSVTLFETEELLMPIQRGNTTRYIHPNIYDWPNEGSGTFETDLPFLNWKADTTVNVIKQIEDEWKLVVGLIDVKTDVEINAIRKSTKGVKLLSNKGNKHFFFECVILAVGFGEEIPIENLAMSLYWTDNGLHQKSGKNSQKVREYLVSGCGDGGLMDTLRLTLKDFKQKEFTEKLLSENFPDLNNALIEIEKNAPPDFDEASDYLLEKYSELDIPEQLENYIKDNLKKNTKVTLNAMTPSYLSTQSSILNRFAVKLVMEFGDVSYIQGKINVTRKESGGYRVTFKTENNPPPGDYDDVIVRHGPTPVIKDLTGKTEAPYNANKKDSTGKKLWTNDFYVSNTKLSQPLTPKAFAENNRPEFETVLAKSRNFTGCIVSGPDKEPFYMVFLNSKSIPEMFKEYQEFMKVPVKYLLEQKFENNMQEYADATRSNIKKRATLGPGVAIRNITLSDGGQGTLGCFLTLPDGQTVILSTSHVLGEPSKTTNYIAALGIDGQDQMRIGKLYDSVRLSGIKAGSDFSDVNLIDAAIAILDPGIRFSSKIPFRQKQLTIVGYSTPEINSMVYKYGSGSGLTKGKVLAVNGTMQVSYNTNRKRAFREVILIESEDGRPFSQPGDSGALIFNEKGIAFGIIFAASGSISIACPIQPILTQFNCKLYDTLE